MREGPGNRGIEGPGCGIHCGNVRVSPTIDDDHRGDGVGGIHKERSPAVPMGEGSVGREADLVGCASEVGAPHALVGANSALHGYTFLEKGEDETVALVHAVILEGSIHRDDEGARFEGCCNGYAE
ncbi:MAG: hypothetical protein ACI855_003466 [Myxococcota bacterium]